DGPPGGDLGTVGVLDETSCAKKGDKTPGAQRQDLGCAGKVDNGVVTVYVGLARSDVRALLDFGRYRPKSWAANRPRCRAAGIPDVGRHRSAWRVALGQLIRLGRSGGGSTGRCSTGVRVEGAIPVGARPPGSEVRGRGAGQLHRPGRARRPAGRGPRDGRGARRDELRQEGGQDARGPATGPGVRREGRSRGRAPTKAAAVPSPAEDVGRSGAAGAGGAGVGGPGVAHPGGGGERGDGRGQVLGDEPDPGVGRPRCWRRGPGGQRPNSQPSGWRSRRPG
ncbi:transposase, partial [bacterium]|nr:transposase [bacterium]